MVGRQFILVFAVALLCAVAQGQKRPDRCKLRFTGDDPAERERIRVGVESVTLQAVTNHGVTNLDLSNQNELIEDIKNVDYNDRAELISEIQEKIAAEWRRLGYFEVQVEVVAEPGSSAKRQLYRVVGEIREGDQLRLDEIQLVSSSGVNAPLAIPAQELRRLIPLKDGDVFDVQKIRDGMDEIRRAYVARGYLDFTATPDFEISHQRKSISIRLTVDEQTQYRISDVSVLGVDPKLAREVNAQLTSGAVFNSIAFNKFFAGFVAAHKRELPADASDQDLSMIRDVKARTIAIRVDFRACFEIPK